MKMITENIASIDHSGLTNKRISLSIVSDEYAYYVLAGEEYTEGRFITYDAAVNSIHHRWGRGWGLEYNED